jgi:hypothetical protein
MIGGAMLDGLGAYRNFAIVVGAQLLWFILLIAARGLFPKAPRLLAVGALAGIPLAAIFDIGIGRFGNIFHYAGLEFGGLFVLLNAILSYGTAVATAAAIPVGAMDDYMGDLRRIALATASFAFAVAIWLPLDRWPPAAGMFLLGALILIATEAFCLAFGAKGYLIQVLEGRWVPLARIWAFAAATGVIYEAVNRYFPLWVWVNRSPTPAINLLMIVSLGYFVLFYPVFAGIGLFRGHFGKISRVDRMT